QGAPNGMQRVLRSPAKLTGQARILCHLFCLYLVHPLPRSCSGRGRSVNRSSRMGQTARQGARHVLKPRIRVERVLAGVLPLPDTMSSMWLRPCRHLVPRTTRSPWSCLTLFLDLRTTVTCLTILTERAGRVSTVSNPTDSLGPRDA